MFVEDFSLHMASAAFVETCSLEGFFTCPRKSMRFSKEKFFFNFSGMVALDNKCSSGCICCEFSLTDLEKMTISPE